MADEDKDKQEEERLSVDDIDFGALADPSANEEPELEELEDPKTDEDEDKDDEDKSKKDDKSDEGKSKSKSKESDEEDEDDDDKGDKGDKDDEPRVVDTIMQGFGYEFEEGELEGIEDTEEGLTKLTKLIGQKESERRYNEMVEASPNVKALYEYEASGGDPEDFIKTFYPPTDFSKISIDENDVDSQKEIIRASLQSKGLSDGRIKRNIQAIEDSGNLLDESKDSLNDLREVQKQEKQHIVKETEARKKAQREQAEESWKEVNTIIDKGTVRNIPVSESKKEEFKSFINPDPETGVSERDKRSNEMTTEDHLAVDLILFYGIDNVAKMMEKQGSSKATKSLKDKLKSNKDRSRSDSQDPDLEKSSGNVEKLEFRID